MNGYIVASVVTGAAGMVVFSWLLGMWPGWAYPPTLPDKAALMAYLSGLILAVGLIGTSAIMADRAGRTPEPVDRTIPTCTGAATERPGHVVTIDTVTVASHVRANR